MLITVILQLILMFPAPIVLLQDTAAPQTWGVGIHQAILVKATTLVPEGMKRQILRHRDAILRGCREAEAEMAGQRAGDADIAMEYREIVSQLRQTAPFPDICRRLGRLSVLLGEAASPLAGLPAADAERFRGYLGGELKNLPLVIEENGEQFLAVHDIAGYLNWRRQRNDERRLALGDAVRQENGMKDWGNQRSAAWGSAVLCYNDMVLDTARLWLSAWEEGGGGTDDAPYFRIGSAGKNK